MKASGVVIRVDDLGRINIPKEIRIRFDIETGDSLEIFYNEEENGLYLSKYRPSEAQAQIDKLRCIAQDDLGSSKAKKAAHLLEQLETIFNG